MTIECELCGAQVVVKTGRARFCQPCYTIWKRVGYRLVSRLGRNPTQEERMAAAREELAAVSARIAETSNGYCLYCGSTSRGEYCPRCERNGFANVHRVTGKTNGWDKKKSSLGGESSECVEIRGGWRGRKVCGGKVYSPWVTT